MSLREYNRKRNFGVTAEPEGKEKPQAKGRHFVVQKHDATRLHYDFRLEMDGVLKSWAVPKGFPSKRGERRLAVEVEDHPLDYADFEGIIPKGQYGGGTVMVWDFGTYTAGEGDPLQELKGGKLRCHLEGEKLKGEWTLVRGSRPGDERNWFLIKTGEEGRPISKKLEEHSALSGRTMAQIASQQDAVWQSNRPEKGAVPESDAPEPNAPAAHVTEPDAPRPAAEKPKKPTRRQAKTPAAKKALGSAKPRWIDPMKATLATSLPVGDDWLYELKWDGYRALAIKDGHEVELISRNKKPLTADFPEIAEAIGRLPAETAVIDAEICALDAEGRPSFQLLQSREMGQARPSLFLYAFDLLHLDGHDLMSQPLVERKAALETLLEGAPEELRYSGFIEGKVEQLLDAVRERGMEGLIGKLRDSTYQAGVRSKAWLKLKVSSEQEFVIGGYTPPQGSRKHFGALLVGYYEKGKLHFAGKVGTGFNVAWLKRLSALMDERPAEKCPFVNLPQKSTGRWSQGITATEMRRCPWCRPELVCQVRFTEWTNDGSLRHPVFLGLRDDKAAGEVRRE